MIYLLNISNNKETLNKLKLEKNLKIQKFFIVLINKRKKNLFLFYLKFFKDFSIYQHRKYLKNKKNKFSVSDYILFNIFYIKNYMHLKFLKNILD